MKSFNQSVIKHKTGLLNLAAELGNVSKACRIMGFSRDTFYRYQAARDAGGVEALFEVSRRKPNLKNRVEEVTEQAVVQFATAFPAYGQVRAGNELRKQGIFVSPSGVRSIWLRHDLASMKQRLTALEKMSAEQGLVLTEAQVQALERKKQDDEVCGEIESHHPGYLGSQDTFYVGTIKGVGRIYQQTFVDTYSKWAAAKLYTTKTPITGADLLNDRVLPFFVSQQMGIIRILTDRGTEYCGKLETHDYQLYLGVNGIEHTRTVLLVTLTGNNALNLFPSIFDPSQGWRAYVLPCFALGFYPMCYTARQTRSAMLDSLSQEYIKTARAKGLKNKKIIFKHALRNALIPVITYLGPQVAFTLCGGFVVESVFSIPGLGRYFVQSIQNRDYPVIMGTTIFLAAFIILMNLVVDLLYKVADPRISLAKGGE